MRNLVNVGVSQVAYICCQLLFLSCQGVRQPSPVNVDLHLAAHISCLLLLPCQQRGRLSLSKPLYVSTYIHRMTLSLGNPVNVGVSQAA